MQKQLQARSVKAKTTPRKHLQSHRKNLQRLPHRKMAIRRQYTGIDTAAVAVAKRPAPNNTDGSQQALQKIKDDQEREFESRDYQSHVKQRLKLRETRYTLPAQADEIFIKRVQVALLGVMEAEPELRALFRRSVVELDGFSDGTRFQSFMALLNQFAEGSVVEVQHCYQDYRFENADIQSMALANQSGLFQVFSQQGSSLEPVIFQPEQRSGPIIKAMLEKCKRILPWEDLIDAHWDVTFDLLFDISPSERRKMKQTLTPREARSVWLAQVDHLSSTEFLDTFRDITSDIDQLPKDASLEDQVDYASTTRQILVDLLATSMQPFTEKLGFKGTPGFFHLQKALDEHVFDSAVNDAFALVDTYLDGLQKAQISPSQMSHFVSSKISGQPYHEISDLLAQRDSLLEPDTSSQPSSRPGRLVRRPPSPPLPSHLVQAIEKRDQARSQAQSKFNRADSDHE